MKKLIYSLTLLISIHCTAQWTQVNNGITDLTQGAKLLGHSATHVFAGTLIGAKMFSSNDNGANWNEIQPPVAFNVPECGYYFNGKYFAGLNASSECIYYSSDNGSSWNVGLDAPTSSVVRGFIHLQNDLFAYTSNAGIYRSIDGGINWSQQNNGLTNLNVISMEVISMKLYASTIGGGIFISTNNGTSWSPSNNGIAGGDLNGTAIWRMGDDLYYYSQAGSAYWSSDEGVNWNIWTIPSEFGLGLNEIYRSGSHLYLETRHYTTGLLDSIYFSDDEGASWQNISDNLNVSDLNGSGITEHNGYVYIAYNGMSPNEGIYRRGVNVGIEENNSSMSALTLYPNPAKDFISVHSGYIDMATPYYITNVSGKIISSSIIDPGKNKIDTSGLPQGIYFIRIENESKEVVRIVKL